MVEEAPEASEPTYELKLTGNGVTIERTVPSGVARAVVALVMGGSPAASGSFRSPSRPLGSPAAATVEPGQSVGEFITEVEAKRNPDKIAAIAVYLADAQGLQTFTRDEVRSMFQLAGEPLPGNFHRDFSWTVTNKWLGEQHGTPGAYYVTKTGRQAVADHFGKDVKAGTKLTTRRRRRRAAATPEAEE
jgi:hypothetical protein